MYVCGPTVYDYCHIGHARSLIVFDTIRRYLEYTGYDVIYVQNFTDIDDKMINRANRDNIEVFELAEKYINRYFEDTEPLNLKRATYHPRATAVIPEMIDIIQMLLDKGYAYSVEGNIYYDTTKFLDYGKLAGFKVDEIEESDQEENTEVCTAYITEKKNRKDFALWKKEKEGEPSWWSPWGRGRPGWHMECSTMSIKYLGVQIDIHGGGQDLIFPHHENEIAQSEAYSDKKPFVKYWLHNGFVNINSEKMSKSLGNFITIKDALTKYPGEVLRFLLVSTHYKKPIDFTESQMEKASRTLDKFYISLDYLDQYSNIISNYIDKDIKKSLLEEEKELLYIIENDFIEAMNDDFDVHNAILSLLELVRYINGKMENPSSFSIEFIDGAFNALTDLGETLGLFLDYKYPSEEAKGIKTTINFLLKIRDNARSEKNYDLADQIRDRIGKIGFLVKDFEKFSLYQRVKK
jgi:cysteinyl-tRNA synthetase